jgi:hypothetical protein
VGRKFGLKAMTQVFSQTGHFFGVARGLIAAIEIAIPHRVAFDLRSWAPRLGESGVRRLSLLQLLKTLERPEIFGDLRDQGCQFLALAIDIPAHGCDPRREAVDFRGCRQLGREVLDRGPRFIEPIRSNRPVQPRPPDGSIIGTAAETVVKQPPPLVVGAGPDRQIRPPQPDPVVVGSQAADLVEVVTKRLSL